MFNSKKYLNIVEHYEKCLEKFGDNNLGVDWPNKIDAQKRYQVMLDIIKPAGCVVSVLDFGCGTAHLYEYILNNTIQGIKYSGLDISDKFYQLCLKKFPDINFLKMDVLEDSSLPMYDYILMNGVFTEKVNLDYEEMMIYFQSLIKEIFPKCIFGTAFNVMSDNVDWQRDDLFHLPLGVLKEFLINNITDNYEVRDDYGLYEYTVYLYK